jgi:hypothetical protein
MYQILKIWRMNNLPAIQVNMDKPSAIGARIDSKESILRLIKALNAVKLRCFDEISLGIVGPSVVATAQHQRGSSGLLCDSVGSVTAYIVKGARNLVFTEHDDNGEASDIESDVVSGLVEATAVSYADPCLQKRIRS